MEIIRGIHAIPGTHISRVYLVEGDDLTLIDAGMPWSAGRVFSYIRSIGRQPAELRRILMTHNHPDHTSGAPGILRQSSAHVAAHREDSHYHDSGRSLSYMGVFSALDVRIPFLRLTRLDYIVEDGELIPAAGGIRVLHTPGHTPGSVCYFLEQEGVLFSGDTIFSDQGRVSRSMPFPGNDKERYQRSLERLTALDFDILCGGHGSPLVGDASREFRKMMNRKPQLPTWGEFFFKRAPNRLLHHLGFTGEDY